MSEIYAYSFVYQGGYKEICEGCESKKSKIAVRTRIRAREEGVCIESLMIWKECFERKEKLPHRRWRSWIEIVSMVAT